jgi:pimeloyl-ACP methyl ester carboxylesterase
VKRLPRDRELWLRFYREPVDALSREQLRSLYLVAIDFDEAEAPLPVAFRGEMLLLEGSEDRVASEKSRDALKAAYPRAEHLTLEGAGHALALERPEEWQNAVTRFLKTRGRA